MSFIEIEDLKRLRRGFGLTQKQLAVKAGVSQSLIARIESGTIDPRFSTIKKIFDAFTPIENTLIAKDVMSSPVESINAQDNIRTVVEKMKRTGFSQLPVLMDGRIIGKIHESAILDKIAKSNNPKDVMLNSAYNLMEKPFLKISCNEKIDKIVEFFSKGEPALLVYDGDILTGIITKIDVLSAGINRIGSDN
jgi:predicted transcriptional regulator